MAIKQPPANSFPWKNAVAAVLVILGVLIIGVSFVWPGKTTRRAAWSDVQAEKYQAASLRVHSLAHEVANARPGQEATINAKLEQAKAEYQQVRNELDAAVGRPNRIAWGMRILGVALALAGGALIWMMPEQTP